MSKSYDTIYSPQAFLDLAGLYEYIRFTLEVPKTAEKQVNHIRNAVRSLETMPMRYPLVGFRSSTLCTSDLPNTISFPKASCNLRACEAVFAVKSSSMFTFSSSLKVPRMCNVRLCNG